MAGVACHRCGHGYTDHVTRGGECAHGYEHGASECPCPAFRWVDPKSAPPAPLRAPASS